MIHTLAYRRSRSATTMDALALYQTLAELSVEATGAAEANDGETVLRILAERVRIMERSEELVGRLLEEGNPASTAAVLDAARELASLDASLRDAIGRQRDALGRDLTALENGGVARSAYGGLQQGRDTINVVR